jgi:hypothetical protein
MSIEDPAELWDAVKRDYLEELQRGRYYLRNDLTSLKLQECGPVDACVAKIQNLLDQYKLCSNNKESIGAQEQVFCLFHGIPEGGDWDVELRLIQDKLETDDWYNQPTTIIKKLKNRESELRKARSIASDVLLYTTAATTSSKNNSAKGKSDTKKDNERPDCTHCEKKGHIEETCREKHGKPKRKKEKHKGKSNRSEKSDKATANVAASFGDQHWTTTTAQR